MPHLKNVLLTVRNGGLVEYNATPVRHHIRKISFSKSVCFGRCPAYDLTIDQNGKTVFFAHAYNFSDELPKANRKLRKGETYENMGYETYQELHSEGTYQCVIGKQDLDTLFSLIDYLDFPRLREGYSIPVTDNPTAEITITYDDGKVKKIRDYGERGTYGLRTLYRLMDELRFSQKWNPELPPNTKRRG